MNDKKPCRNAGLFLALERFYLGIMNDFELTVRYVAGKIPLQFRQGDSDTLKNMMFKNDNEFLRFAGKEQFLKMALAIYPNIDRDMLYEDFLDIMKASHHAFMRCNELNDMIVNNVKQGKIRLQFRYFQSLVDTPDGKGCYDAAISYKTLDGLTLHYKNPFWKVHFPPNFHGDCCYVRFTTYDDETDIPEILPQVEEKYQIDYLGIFFPDNESYKIEITDQLKSEHKDHPSPVMSFVGMDFNVKELTRHAQYQIIDENDEIPMDEKPECKKLVDIELDKAFKDK